MYSSLTHISEFHPCDIQVYQLTTKTLEAYRDKLDSLIFHAQVSFDVQIGTQTNWKADANTREQLKHVCAIVSRYTQLITTGELTLSLDWYIEGIPSVHVSIDELYAISTTRTFELVYQEAPYTLVSLTERVYQQCDICGKWQELSRGHWYGDYGYFLCGNADCEKQMFDAQGINGAEVIRDQAITWQASVSERQNISYGELIEAQDYFYSRALRYGLVEEFQENGIC